MSTSTMRAFTYHNFRLCNMTAVSEDRATLDSVLRHHLSLDPAANVSKEHPVASGISQSDSNVKNSKLKKRVSLKEFTDAPTGIIFINVSISMNDIQVKP